MVRLSLLFIALAAAPMAVVPAQIPPAATKADVWTPAQTQEILSRTQTIRLAPEISHLSSAERTAVGKLIEVGGIFQRIYEDQRHHQALAAKARVREGSPDATLYRLFPGADRHHARQSPGAVPGRRRAAAGQECLSARPHPGGI